MFLIQSVLFTITCTRCIILFVSRSFSFIVKLDFFLFRLIIFFLPAVFASSWLHIIILHSIHQIICFLGAVFGCLVSQCCTWHYPTINEPNWAITHHQQLTPQHLKLELPTPQSPPLSPGIHSPIHLVEPFQ